MCWNARTKPRLVAAPPQCGVALMRHSRSVSVLPGARASDEPPRGRFVLPGARASDEPPRGRFVLPGARASDEPPRGRLGDRVDDGDLHADLLLAWLDGHGRRRRAVSGALRE